MNIVDEKHPFIEREFKLQMNYKENCPVPGKIELTSGGIVSGPGTAASHFNDVDSAIDTRLVLFQFTYAGLRIVDLRNPTKPAEVGYFKPGDVCASHVRYVPKSGRIWFACNTSGIASGNRARNVSGEIYCQNRAESVGGST